MNILPLEPPPVNPPVYTDHEIRGLLALEYDLIGADAALGDLLQRLQTLRLPQTPWALDEVTRIRFALRAVLLRLDEPITAAVLAAEALEPAPF